MSNVHRHKLLLITCVPVAAVFISGHCYADTVWLTNGDRISGEIIEISGTALKLKTSYADTLSLDTNAIHSFATDSAHTLQVDLKKQTAQVQKSDEPGHVKIDDKNIAIHDLTLLPEQPHWKKSGLVETTLDVDNDQNRKEKFHINSELRLESEKWRHELKVEIKHDKEKEKLTEDTEEYDYTLDYLFSEHWLLRTDTSYREDGTTIANRYIYADIGPGYRLWGENQDKLDIIVSYGHFWIKTGPISTELNAVSADLDYTQHWFDKKLETFADLQMSHIYLSGVDYILDSSFGLRLYITHRIHLSLKYDYNETQYSFGSIKDSSYVLGAGINL